MSAIFSFFHVRRRSSLLKVCGFLTFLCLVCLWVKSEQNANSQFKRDEKHEDLTINEIESMKVKDKLIQPPAPLMAGLPPKVQIPPEDNDIHVIEAPVVGDERQKAERMFAIDDAKVQPGLGEGGKAVRIAEVEKSEVEAVMKVEAFNKILSDKIALNRSVPDSRDSL